MATLVVYFSLIVPANDEGQEIKAQTIARQNFVDGQKAAISQVQKLIDSYKGEGQLQDVVSSILPMSEDLAGAFSQVGGLVQNNRLLMQVTTVSVSAEDSVYGKNAGGAPGRQLARPFKPVNFQVKAVGTYEDFKSFLKNLETNIRIFDANRIDIQPAGKPNQDIYTYDITITTYYQAQ